MEENMARFVPFFLIMLFLCSCNFSSVCERSKIKVEGNPSLEHAKSEALEGEGFKKGPWPEEDWWTTFHDDQLTAFIEEAFKESPSLKSVEANIKAVRERALAVRAQLFPQINAVFSLLWQYLNPKGIGAYFPLFDSNFQFYDVGASFSYEFDFWGKYQNQYLAALGEEKAEKARLDDAKRILATAISLQYFQLQSNRMKLEILSEILSKKKKILELSLIRKTHRLSSGIDVNRAQEEILVFEQSVAALKGEVELEKSLLFTLMGKNPDEEFPIKLHWKMENKPFQLPKQIGLDLLTRRPDLMVQIWLVESAAKNVGVAIANFYPNVNLAGFLGLASFGFPELLKSSAFLPAAIPLISQPIFQGGKLRANFRASTARFEALVHGLNDSVLRAANEVVSGITRLQTVNEKLELQLKNVQVTKENYDLISQRYQSGIDSKFTLLRSDEQYLMAKYQKTELEYERVKARIELIKALGGGFEDKEGNELKRKYG